MNRQLPFFMGFVVVGVITWSPGGLVDFGQRKTNPDASPVASHLRCVITRQPCD